MTTNIPHAKTEAEHIVRYREIQILLKTATDEQRRLLLIEEGLILGIINPTSNPEA